jgi:site-specific recombinase XerD
MTKIHPRDRSYIDFVMQFPEGKHMLEKIVKDSTKIAYAKAVNFLTDFLGKTPTQIVQEYQADVKRNLYEASDKWEPIFDDFATYLKNEKKYSSATVTLYHSGAKNLINMSVPRRMSVQAKTPIAFSRTIAGVPFNDLKEIFAISNVRERAIIAFLKDSGMSKADVVGLNLDVLENFERGDQFIHLDVYREKESVEYETFIGPNATEALKAYFILRRSHRENLTPKSPLFVIDEIPFSRLDPESMSTAFQRLTKRSGKVISTHRLRKFFETYMALVVRHPIILKYWMGHRIGKGRDIEARYIIPPTPEQLKLYQEAYHNIDLTGGTLEERAKTAAKEQFEKMLTPEQREVIAKSGLKLMRKKENVSATKDECEDGKHCGENKFKQILETKLLRYLKNGWQIVYKLANGEVIVRQ